MEGKDVSFFLAFEKDYENVMLPAGFRTDFALYLSNFFPQYSWCNFLWKTFEKVAMYIFIILGNKEQASINSWCFI